MYRNSLCLDQYQLSCVSVYIECGLEDTEATFNLFYRKNPFNGSYCIFTGLEKVIQYIQDLHFSCNDISWMKKNFPSFPNKLWDYLSEFKFTGSIESVSEGTMVQPYVPIIQVTAPLPQAQLIETQLLTLVTYPTMVSTKSFRITNQTNKPWIEFGLRGAPGFESAIEATRSAYIGGASATSNVEASRIYGIPCTGTMSHSFIMSFDNQIDAFKNYMKVFKENSVLLIDTYNYEEGIVDAIKSCRKLNLQTFRGVRDDSGDLAKHSKLIRKYLDNGNLKNTMIAVSNEIDEHTIQSINLQDNSIDIFGCGRKVVTYPDMGTVYKIVKVGDRDVIKISGNQEKITDPGKKKVLRVEEDHGFYCADLILHDSDMNSKIIGRKRNQDFITQNFNTYKNTRLLENIFINGNLVYKKPTLNDIRNKVKSEAKKMWPGMFRIDNPSEYPVFLSEKLFQIKRNLLLSKNSKNNF